MVEQIKIAIFKLLNKFIKKRIIFDSKGHILNPEDNGEKCHGNGEYKNFFGTHRECLCDECDYQILCCKITDDNT